VARVGYPIAIVSSLVVGLVLAFALAIVWSYIPTYSPIPEWLRSAGLTWPAQRVAFFVLDLLINVLLSIPAAYILWRLRPRHFRLYIAIAVIPGLVWQLSLMFPFGEVSSVLFVPGIVSQLLMLPIAAVVIAYLARERNA
jgi:hypothetical protein